MRERKHNFASEHVLYGVYMWYGVVARCHLMTTPLPPSLTPPQIAINALWLAPLRFFLLVLPSIIMGGISATIITMCENFDEENPQPLTGWRR